MANFIIKIEKEDIKTSKLGENIRVKCDNLDLIFTPEALDELIEDYKLLFNQNKIDIHSEEYEFGKNYYYKKGDICVWNGGNPCIFRINKYEGLDCYSSTLITHNSLSIRFIRPATEKEIKLLGDKEALFITK